VVDFAGIGATCCRWTLPCRTPGPALLTGWYRYDEELAYSLNDQLIGISVEVVRNDKHTKNKDVLIASVAIDLDQMAWTPHPWWRPVSVGMICTR
jgi:hypothetical protein